MSKGLQFLRQSAGRCRSIFERASVAAENLFPQPDKRIIIIDDYFPCLLTAFRIAEINGILRHFQTAVVFSTFPDRQAFSRYKVCYPELASRVRRYHPSRRLQGSAAYIIFINNAFNHIEQLEQASLPFVFELYPGGGFDLDNAASDEKLSRVIRSPMFRKVVVTQDVARDYLLQRHFCRQEQVEFIFGGVILSDNLREIPGGRCRYGINKSTLDICFVANKYMPRGEDKGYDRFIQCAHILSIRYPQSRFHVVGNFTELDIEVSALRDRITFYGAQFTPFFPKFYSGMDLILSPNIPFSLSPGGFDGFPTGCCIEAALCGTAMFVTDELGLNGGRFKDGDEIVIISRDPQQMAADVERYIVNPSRLAQVAEAGRKAVRTLFSIEHQMAPRLRVLSDLLAAGKST